MPSRTPGPRPESNESPLVQLRLQNPRALAGLKFLIRILAPRRCQKLIIGLQRFFAKLQVFEHDGPQKEVSRRLRMQRAYMIERVQRLRVLVGGDLQAGQLAPRLHIAGLLPRDRRELARRGWKLVLI